MNNLTKGLVAGAVTAVMALGIVWAITLVRDTPLLDAIRQPAFWLVEGAAILIAVAAVATEPDDEATSSPSPHRVVAHAAWAAGAAVMIGVLLGVATDTPITELLTSLKFLIPAGITITIAALEALPSNDQAE